MATTNLDSLPEECLARVISFTSPRDASILSLVSTVFRVAADSDLSWEKFLPFDYKEIIARAVIPVEFSSKKDLFRKLSSVPLLIDGGKKTFLVDKLTNKKCYMLSARELSIAWSTDPLCWCWKPLAHSRFPEGVELVLVCWLQIRGKINTPLLSPNTAYGAYLVFQIASRAFGLDVLPLEVEIQVGNYQKRANVSMGGKDCAKEGEGRGFVGRGDGWLEMKLGDFNSESNARLKLELKEIKGAHLKGGLIVEGIELRPS